MKKLFFMYIQILMLSIVFMGCGNRAGREYSKVNRMLSGMNTYTVTAEIIVKGNRAVESYIVKQHFKYPDRYRIEVISPAEKQGKVTAYDGTNLWIYQPKIKQFYVLENYKEMEESTMFPGCFARNLFSGEKAEYSIVKEENHEYISVKVLMPGSNRYRQMQIMYFDRESIIPKKMEILDSQGNTAVTIYYRDFLYNERIDEKLFLMENMEGTQ